MLPMKCFSLISTSTALSSTGVEGTPDEHGSAPIVRAKIAAATGRHDLFHCGSNADAVKREVGTADRLTADRKLAFLRGKFVYGFDWIYNRGINRMSCAKRFSEFQFLVIQINSDDWICASDFGPHNRAQTNATDTENNHTLSWLDFRCVDHQLRHQS